eukprot:3429559-Alexandrium_andersonii.AAC.1
MEPQTWPPYGVQTPPRTAYRPCRAAYRAPSGPCKRHGRPASCTRGPVGRMAANSGGPSFAR